MRGCLRLGIQGPHYDYQKTVSNGMTYSQNILKTDSGFRKYYTLTDDNKIAMNQIIDYRICPFQEAVDLFLCYGLEYDRKQETKNNLFLRFNKV